MAPRKILVALDSSEHSRAAVEAVFGTHCCLPTDQIHLVTVASPISGTVWPPLELMIGPGAVQAHQAQAESERAVEYSDAKATLLAVSNALMRDYIVLAEDIQMHVLQGTKGVSNKVLLFAGEEKVDMIVAGSRGMGAMKSSLMSIVGLGSVSDSLVKEALCPVLLVRPHLAKEGKKQAKAGGSLVSIPADEGKRVCVAYDGSQASIVALTWAIKNVLQPRDELHIASVVAITPKLSVVGEPSAAPAKENDMAHGEEGAFETKLYCESAVATALEQGVPLAKIATAVLNAGDAGSALSEYSHSRAIDVVVCGRSGMGTFKRVLERFTGLGSVSAHLAHTVQGILIVVPAPATPSVEKEFS